MRDCDEGGVGGRLCAGRRPAVSFRFVLLAISSHQIKRLVTIIMQRRVLRACLKTKKKRINAVHKPLSAANFNAVVVKYAAVCDGLTQFVRAWGVLSCQSNAEEGNGLSFCFFCSVSLIFVSTSVQQYDSFWLLIRGPMQRGFSSTVFV